MSLAPVLTRPPVGSPVAFCKHVRERGLWVLVIDLDRMDFVD